MENDLIIRPAPRPVGIDMREEDDLRLPNSLLTSEEHKRIRKLAVECEENKQNNKQKNARILLIDEQHPYYPIYKILEFVAKRHEDAGEPERCVFCGKPLTDENRISKAYKCCICMTCKIKLCSLGRVPGTNNTRGYKFWQKPCRICGTKMAVRNFNGMCRACYRLGERHHTKDPKELTRLRNIISCNNNVIIGKMSVTKGFSFSHHMWSRDGSETGSA